MNEQDIIRNYHQRIGSNGGRKGSNAQNEARRAVMLAINKKRAKRSAQKKARKVSKR